MWGWRHLEMTEDEQALARQIGEPYLKKLPAGGYLILTALTLGQWAVRRSNEGDLLGWAEEWMFDDGAKAKVSFLLLFHGCPHALGWTRHVWMDEHGVSQREYPSR